MEFKQATLDEILESEREMVLRGAERFGDFYVNASTSNSLLRNFIKSVNLPDRFIFAAFYSQIKKHHTLALFSAVRLHYLQAQMDLRQTLEAAQWAAFAMANPDQANFYDKNQDGTMNVKEKHWRHMYRWLKQNYPSIGNNFKWLKKTTSVTAHSSIIYTFQNFNFNKESPHFETPFFDYEDNYRVKTGLWLIANVARGILDVFHGVNQQHGVFQLVDGFPSTFSSLIEMNDRLREEMKAHPRSVSALGQTSTVRGSATI